MTRKRKPEEAAAIKAQIVQLVRQSPKTGEEISAAIGISGSSIGVYFSKLFREEKLSRHEYAKGRFRYYPSGEAPAGSYRDNVKPALPPQAPKMAYRVPVKKVNVARSYFADAIPIPVTLPAAPWECVA